MAREVCHRVEYVGGPLDGALYESPTPPPRIGPERFLTGYYALHDHPRFGLTYQWRTAT